MQYHILHTCINIIEKLDIKIIMHVSGSCEGKTCTIHTFLSRNMLVVVAFIYTRLKITAELMWSCYD